MKTIGITGGVGAGKTLVLGYLETHYPCRVLLADEVAHLVKEPGQRCYLPLVKLLGEDVLLPDETIDKQKMAQKIFAQPDLLEQVNQIVHPAVEAYILQEIEQEKQKGLLDYFFVEAALLIECGYGKYVDELWYIYAEESVRRKRLKASRHYTDEKIDSIMNSQLSEEDFRKHCHRVIDNSGEPASTYGQLEQIMRSL